MNPSTASAMLVPDRRRMRNTHGPRPRAVNSAWMERLSRTLRTWRERRTP